MNRRNKRVSQFAVCINNKGYEASLKARKLYRVIPNDEAASHGYIRVIDESGEDYGYSASRFFPMALPEALENALTHCRHSDAGNRRLASKVRLTR